MARATAQDKIKTFFDKGMRLVFLQFRPFSDEMLEFQDDACLF